MKDTPANRLVITALHEAGHAVAFVRYGFRVASVSLVSNDTNFLQLGDMDDPYDSRRLIVPTLAGHAVDLRIGVVAECARVIAVEDLKEFAALIQTADTDRKLGYWLARARAFVRRPSNWRAIGDVAHALIKKQELSGDEVRDIVWNNGQAKP